MRSIQYVLSVKSSLPFSLGYQLTQSTLSCWLPLHLTQLILSYCILSQSTLPCWLPLQLTQLILSCCICSTMFAVSVAYAHVPRNPPLPMPWVLKRPFMRLPCGDPAVRRRLVCSGRSGLSALTTRCAPGPRWVRSPAPIAACHVLHIVRASSAAPLGVGLLEGRGGLSGGGTAASNGGKPRGAGCVSGNVQGRREHARHTAPID